MRRIVLVVALLVCATSARAASSVFLFGGGPGVVSATAVQITVTGSLVVSFHGDQSTGCAARGLCGYSGVITWRPQADASRGFLNVEKLRTGGRTSYQASLNFYSQASSPADLSASVLHQVPGQPLGTCVDGSSKQYSLSLPVRGGRILVRVLGGGSSLLSTRCAGPLDSDIASVLPARSVPIPAAPRAHLAVDLSTVRSFAAGGLAGTVRSTLVLGFGHRTRVPISSQPTQNGVCRDSVALGPGDVSLVVTGKVVSVSYGSFSGISRTRCPGPVLGGPGQSLATGTLPLRELARRRFSISLRAVKAFSDDGYTGHVAGSIRLTFTRGA
jgi:hypothetical protein